MSIQHRTCILLFCALWPVLGAAGESNFSASIGVEVRGFLQSGRFTGQDDELQASILLNPEWRWRSDEGNQRISIIPYARLDSIDDERSHVDLREAYWAYEGDDWEILAGINKVFWGVAESRHLIDIINQTDLVEDPDEEDKLGQPMINLSLQRDWGLLSGFLLPYFRERTFPGENGRLRPVFPVNTDQPRYPSGAGQRHLDLALRYSHYFGNFDVGAYYFRGTSREPRFEAEPLAQEFIPVYDSINQIGIDLQYTGDTWLWKLETILRDGATDNFVAFVGGFEYTLFQLNNTAADIGFLMEYLYDERKATEAFTLFDHDLFTGMRLTLNDVQDTNLLAGIVIDTDSAETFINFEAERRIGDHLKAEFRLRLFVGAGATDPSFSFERDDYIQFRLSQFF